MAASYSIHDFVGNGVLKDVVDKLEADGWDDVPTLKMINAADMEALQLTDEQRDALELRTYLHDRSLMQYADNLESLHKSLPELLNTNPTVLTGQYGMRRGHVARFVDRSSACGIQLPPNLSLPARKRSIAVKDGDNEYGNMIIRSGAMSEVSPPASMHSSQQQRRRMSYDQLSMESQPRRRMSQDGVDSSRHSGQNGFSESFEARKPGYEDHAAPLPIKGILAQAPEEPRLCGLVKPTKVANDITPISTLEKIYVQRLTPEHKKGTDPWSGGDLKLPPPMKVAELWATKPTLLLCLRRPGCVMCRAEAHQLYARKPIFDAMGVQLVAVLNEYIDAEVKAFWPRYWGGMVVVDRNRDLFKSLGGGKLMKDNLLTGFFFNKQARRNWKRATSTGFSYNLQGEGNIKGGVYIIGPGKSGVAYQFVERTFGDWAPLEEVLDVCTKLQLSLPKKKSSELYTGINENDSEKESF
ncbi:unnamed protein product [Calypogeia fissa]